MKQNKYIRMSEKLSEKYGLPISVKELSEPNGEKNIDLVPDELHPNDGFSIRMKLGWRSIDSFLIIGRFAGPLIENFGNASDGMKQNFCLLTKRIVDDGAQITFKINDYPCSVSNHDSWPKDQWTRIELTLSKSPLVYDENNQEDVELLISNWGGRLLGCVLCLSPLEEIKVESEDLYSEGLPEGAKTTVTVNRFERSRFNRTTCIDYYGSRCKACGLDFEKHYGSIGTGFIHVHHIVPISKLGPDYRINPITDLVPVCPNCHYMLHRSDPPMLVEELAKLIENSKK